MKKSFCCLLALGMLFLGGCGSGYEKIEVSDVCCPYTMQTQRDGSLQVSVDTAALPGYDWQYDMLWQDVCQVELNQSEKQAVFTLTGLKEGLEEITFLCLKQGENPDYRFEVTAAVSVDGENVVLLQYHSNRTFSGSGAGGENTEFPYLWSTDEQGIVTVAVSCEDSISWSLIGTSCDAYGLSDILYGPEECMFEITPQAAGEGVVVLEHDETGRQLPIRITVGSDLAVELLAEAAANG